MAAHVEERCERICSIRGYHVYQGILLANVVEVVECRREPENGRDRYALY